MRLPITAPLVAIALLACLAAAPQDVPQPPNAPAQAAPAEVKGDPALMPYLSFVGPESNVGKRMLMRAANTKEWKDVWRMHVGDAHIRQSYRADGTPDIDFERCIVVAVFDGESWNSEGVYVVSVEDLGDHVRLRYDEHTYQTAGPDGGGVRVKPFGIFVLPRITKPLVLEENVQGLIGKPPKWKEQARFEKL